MADEYIHKADAVKAIGEEYAPRTDFERGMVSQMSCDKDKIRRLPSADVVSKNNIAVLLDETVKELTSGRKNPIADSFIVSVIGIVKYKIMMMGEE